MRYTYLIFTLIFFESPCVEARIFTSPAEETFTLQAVSLELKTQEERDTEAHKNLSGPTITGEDENQQSEIYHTGSKGERASWLSAGKQIAERIENIKQYCNVVLKESKEKLDAETVELLKFLRNTTRGVQEGYENTKSRIENAIEKSGELYNTLQEQHSVPQRFLKQSSYYMTAVALDTYLSPIIAAELQRNFGLVASNAFLASMRALQSTLLHRMTLEGIKDTKKFTRELITGQAETETTQAQDFTFFKTVSPLSSVMGGINSLVANRNSILKFCVKQGLESMGCEQGLSLAQDASTLFSNTFGLGLSEAAQNLKNYAAACDVGLTLIGRQSQK